MYFMNLLLNTILLTILFFFFSSRRRHTRCLSDWSSDVCSSDLTAGPHRRSTANRKNDTVASHRRRGGEKSPGNQVDHFAGGRTTGRSHRFQAVASEIRNHRQLKRQRYQKPYSHCSVGDRSRQALRGSRTT